MDIGVRPSTGHQLDIREKVQLAIELEDLLDVNRVDLVSLPEADPFVAVNVIRGELKPSSQIGETCGRQNRVCAGRWKPCWT